MARQLPTDCPECDGVLDWGDFGPGDVCEHASVLDGDLASRQDESLARVPEDTDWPTCRLCGGLGRVDPASASAPAVTYPRGLGVGDDPRK
jgi:hypothetical protein